MREEKQYEIGNQWITGMYSDLMSLKQYVRNIDALANQMTHDVEVAKVEMFKEEPKNDYKYILIRG